MLSPIQFIHDAYKALNKAPRALVFGIAAVLVLYGVVLIDGLKIQDISKHRALDALVKLFPYEKYYSDYSKDLVFIAIDDESLAHMGQWPWPRQNIAKITENLAKSGVAASGLDILFIENDRFTPKQLSTLLDIPEGKLALAGAPDGDQTLAKSLSHTPTAIAFALSGEKSVNTKTTFPSRFIQIGKPDEQLLQVPNLIMPLPVLSIANGAGFVNTNQEEGFVRDTPLLAAHDDQIVPSLGLEVMRLAVRAKNYIVKSSDSGREILIKLGASIYPVDASGLVMLHHGHTSRFEKISAYRLFEGVVPDLQGKIAIVGVDALALGDRHSTPLEDAIPGSLLHLQLIDQLLSGRLITSSTVFDQAIYFICALLSIASVFLIIRLPLVYAITLLGVGSACLLAAALYAFIQYGFLFNFPLALLVFFSGGLVSYLLKSFFEEKLRKKMQSSFAQYVPPDVVRRVSKSNHPPRLGGELIEATVLFLDLRGFTAFTESLKDRPELMVKVISTIMNEVTQRLLASGATIDKYIGDAVMAFWNAPEKQENHLARALYAACQIIEDLDLIRNQIYALDEGLRSIQIDFGIGVASGEVTVGNMGSSFRFNYTVLGDAVNTAARLEGMTKSLGDAILVAGISSAQEISFGGRAIELISRGDLEVRGKTEKIPVFAAKFANEGPRR